MSIHLFQGSILDCEVDTIVNPANSFLRHSGGLARIIADKAQPYTRDELAHFDQALETAEQYAAREWQNAHDNAPLIATGNAYATPAGALPFKAVIHAVGPIWNSGIFLEEDLLEIVHESLFDAALELGTSVAVPAISAGVFGCPIDIVARRAVQVAGWYTDQLDITFALMEDGHMAAYQNELYGV